MMTMHCDVHISVLCQRLSEFKLPMPSNGKYLSSIINVIVAPIKGIACYKDSIMFRALLANGRLDIFSQVSPG